MALSENDILFQRRETFNCFNIINNYYKISLDGHCDRYDLKCEKYILFN